MSSSSSSSSSEDETDSRTVEQAVDMTKLREGKGGVKGLGRVL